MSSSEGLIFYKSFYEAIDSVSKDDQLELYKAIPEYVFNQKEIELKPHLKPIWILIKPQLDANITKRKNGKKGGRPNNKTAGIDDDILDLDNL